MPLPVEVNRRRQGGGRGSTPAGEGSFGPREMTATPLPETRPRQQNHQSAVHPFRPCAKRPPLARPRCTLSPAARIGRPVATRCARVCVCPRVRVCVGGTRCRVHQQAGVGAGRPTDQRGRCPPAASRARVGRAGAVWLRRYAAGKP